MEQNIFTTTLLPASLFIIMLGLGLNLQIADFKRIFTYPKAIIIGITNQMILLPLVGFGIAIALNLEPELAVGLIVLAACPGGVTSNLFSHLSNGDIALSVTLTAISSIVSIVTIPILINIGLTHFMQEGRDIHLPIIKTIVQIMVITIIPIALGMLVRYKKPKIALGLEKTVKIVSAFFLFAIIVLIIWTERERMPGYFKQVGIAIGILNIITMLIGFYTAKIGKLSLPQSITIALESGLQNGTLGIVIAVSILFNAGMSIPSAIYGLFMFVTGGFMVWRYGRSKKISNE